MLNLTRPAIFALIVFSILIFFSGNLFAADDKPQSQPDVIVFTNGDQLTGKFVQAIGDTVSFHSDVVGNVTIEWSKIK